MDLFQLKIASIFEGIKKKKKNYGDYKNKTL